MSVSVVFVLLSICIEIELNTYVCLVVSLLGYVEIVLCAHTNTKSTLMVPRAFPQDRTVGIWANKNAPLFAD